MSSTWIACLLPDQATMLRAIDRLPLANGEQERILGRNFTDLIGTTRSGD